MRISSRCLFLVATCFLAAGCSGSSSDAESEERSFDDSTLTDGVGAASCDAESTDVCVDDPHALADQQTGNGDPPDNSIDEKCASGHRITTGLPTGDGVVPSDWIGFSGHDVVGSDWAQSQYVWSRTSTTDAAAKCMKECTNMAGCSACACRRDMDADGKGICYLKSDFICGQLQPSARNTYVKKSSVVDSCFSNPGASLYESGVTNGSGQLMPVGYDIAEHIRMDSNVGIERIEIPLSGNTCAARLSIRLSDAGHPGGPELGFLDIKSGDITSGYGYQWMKVVLPKPVFVAAGQRVAIMITPATQWTCTWQSGARGKTVSESWTHRQAVNGQIEAWWNYGSFNNSAVRVIGASSVCGGTATCSSTGVDHAPVCACSSDLIYSDIQKKCVDNCGNNIKTGTEACDDGNQTNGDTCDNNCTFPACGNGAKSPNEECDDGNIINGDGCDADCKIPVCGNNYKSPSEGCDDGNLTNGSLTGDDRCDSNCKVTGCGNGAETSGEACDDNNLISGDGCDSNCTVTACGNGIKAGVETCDDGNLTNGDGCDSNCTITACGNGIKTETEVCDDGNLIDSHPACVVSGMKSCNNASPPVCTEPTPCTEDTCDSNCTTPRCGNGIKNGTEMCDDGNSVDADACSNNCTYAVCGDGKITHQEICDDGNVINTDGCTAACTLTPGWSCVTAGSACVKNTSCIPDTTLQADLGAQPGSWNTVNTYLQAFTFSLTTPTELQRIEFNIAAWSTACGSVRLDVVNTTGVQNKPDGTVIASRVFSAADIGINYAGKWVVVDLASPKGVYPVMRNGSLLGVRVTGTGTCYIKPASALPSSIVYNAWSVNNSGSLSSTYIPTHPGFAKAMRIYGKNRACLAEGKTCYATTTSPTYECR